MAREIANDHLRSVSWYLWAVLFVARVPGLEGWCQVTDLTVVPLPVEQTSTHQRLYRAIDALISDAALNNAECVGVLDYVKFRIMCDMKDNDSG